MELTTSDKFASAYAVGTDWRDVSRKVLTLLEEIRTGDGDFQLGFLYMTEELVPDAENILALFKNVTQIENWTGASGVGICTTDGEFAGGCALVAMIGHMDEAQFSAISGFSREQIMAGDTSGPRDDAFLTLLHAQPSSPAEHISLLDMIGYHSDGDRDGAKDMFAPESFLVGGVCSSRDQACQIANDVTGGEMSGLSFSQDVNMSVLLTQGCLPLGTTHTITSCHDQIIESLDRHSAFEVFAADMKQKAQDTKALMTGTGDVVSEETGQGEVHIGFVQPGDSSRNYVVRNIAGIDEESGWIMTTQPVREGQEVVFVHRDSQTVKAELSSQLIAFRQRFAAADGTFNPRGALYITSASRSLSQFGPEPGEEVKLIQDVLGTMPIAGFYSDGEISNGRVHGCASILIVFL